MHGVRSNEKRPHIYSFYPVIGKMPASCHCLKIYFCTNLLSRHIYTTLTLEFTVVQNSVTYTQYTSIVNQQEKSLLVLQSLIVTIRLGIIKREGFAILSLRLHYKDNLTGVLEAKINYTPYIKK